LKRKAGSFLIDENAELALAFYLIVKDVNVNNEKILSFSRLLWPFLSIQGVIQTHIILDGITIFSRKDKFTNPPRQPLIGHILRNVDERSEIELLERVIEVLMYQDAEAEEIGSGEESEYQTLEVEGLVNPEHLQSILMLIPYLEYLPIIKYVPLDTTLSTEIALDVSEKYRAYIETMKGNVYRWETQINLIGEAINKWMTNLNVEIKDTEMRFSSQITKTKDMIDDIKVKEQIEIEHDKIDQWKVNEKKNVIENISVLLKTAERQLSDIINQNRLFTDDESLKSKVFDDLVPQFDNHFKYLKDESQNFVNSVESFYQKYVDLKDQTKKIDSEADEKLDNITKELNTKLEDRNLQISEFQKEEGDKLSELNTYRTQIENLFKKINEISQNKIKNCQQEADDLISWSIKDTKDELFSKPIQWIYMPFYAMFIENEDLMEERMKVIFPGYIGDDTASLYENVSETFSELTKALSEKIEDDVKTRSNFEFSVESKNLIKDPDFKKQIEQGIAILKNKNLLNEEMEAKILKFL
jgi:septal ring factor EnvC (AmiA/AmiB activator)